MTFRPAKGPWVSLTATEGSGISPSLESRQSLGEKRAIAFAEVGGAETGVTLVGFLRAQRRRIGQPANELLVPAVYQRRAGDDIGDARPHLLFHPCIDDHPIDKALLLGLGRAEHAAFEQDL